MKKLAALTGMVVLFAFSASAGFAGEVQGNGTYKGVKGNSPCSFSGQEDLQYVDGGSKGDPAHSQNWGHVKQALGLTGGANETVVFGELTGCNGKEFGMHDGPTAP
jgi:hypothetical protein